MSPSVILIHLCAALTLLLQLFPFYFHCQVKLFKEALAKFCRNEMGRLLYQGDHGVLSLLSPCLTCFVVLSSVVFGPAIAIIIWIISFVIVVVAPFLTSGQLIYLNSLCLRFLPHSFHLLQQGYKLLDSSSLKLFTTCSCDSMSLASLKACWTVLGGLLISTHLLAILFLMFLVSDVTKSLMMWGCLSSSRQMTDDLRSAHPHL